MNDSIPSFDIVMQFQITQEHRNISRCPDSRLAPSRNPRVRGWMRRLIVSIITITGIRGVGVPCGTKWESLAFQFLRRPAIWMASQIGQESLKVVLK